MLLTAGKIYDGRKWLPSGTVIETNADGEIIALHKGGVKDAVHYEGILAPGFVNVHCHLELSHMKGMISEHTGLISFLQQVMIHRNSFSDEQRKAARYKAFNAMYDNGVVAVGDIANTTDTLDLRATGEMHFHTFVESIGFTETPQKQFGFAASTYNAFIQQQPVKKLLAQSIVPHAPYSVSHTMFGLIDKFDKTALISIHNQESRAEDEYYLLKKGGVQTLLHSLGISDEFFMPSGKSSLQTYVEWISPSHPIVFVHNTYTTQNDVQIAQALSSQVSWCLCPNANLYIENTLPDIDMFIQEDVNICIGTDSLSSNYELSVLSELYTIKKHFPHLDWGTLLGWGTCNGAKALQMDDIIGTIEVGKQPGIIQVKGLDLPSKPVVKRIL